MESIRILILEDDESTGVLLSDFLRGIDGLEVLGVARDGMSGLARIYAETPDLLLLDLVMPKMSGLEVLRALREKPAGGEMKILVLSGVTDDATVQYALSLGACHYIMKPARHSALLDWIQMAFRPGPQEESGLVSAARWQLRRMGGTGGAGLTCTALAAAALAALGPDALLKEGYAEACRVQRLGYTGVEKRIRDFIARLHRADTSEYRRLLGEKWTEKPPSNGLFLSLLAQKLRKGRNERGNCER